METSIREAVDSDQDIFIEYAVKLSKFNRNNHDEKCKYDDYESVLDAIRDKAEETFLKRDNNTLILIAELDGSPVGYVLGRIYEEELIADNGGGRVGLLDELFLDEAARGHGLGQKLINEVIDWMKNSYISRVKLHAYSWNTNAKKIYEQFGFKEYAVSYERYL